MNMEKEYKFILNSKNKGFCPACHKKKCFVYYYWRGTTNIVNESCGVCDHVNGCGYKLGPWELTGKELEAVKNNANYKIERPNMTPIKEQTPIIPIPDKYVIDSDIVRPDTPINDISKNNLTHWIETLPGINHMAVVDAISKYHIGTTRTGDVIFWQIDEFGRVITGKRMSYQPNGHRVKDAHGNGAVGWVHTQLKAWGVLPLDYELDGRQSLFGMHLIRDSKNDTKPICIVESEKTALLCSIYQPKYVWLATGGIHNLKREKLTTLIQQRRKIILYPDRDGINIWLEKAKEINYSLLTVNDYCASHATAADGPTTDLADIIVRRLQSLTPEPARPPDEIHELIGLYTKHEILSELIKRYDLYICHNQ